GIVPNGTNFTVTMRIDARNSGDVTLQNVQLTDDLDSVFSGVQSFTLTSKSATGLTINTNFNGTTDMNLLVGTNTLAVGATGSVLVPAGSTTVNVDELDPQYPTGVTLTAGSTDPTTVTVPANGSATVDTGYLLPPGTGMVRGYIYQDINDDGDGLFEPDLGDIPIA